MRLCKCGCGGTVEEGRRFISGHNFRILKRTKKHNAAIAKGQRKAWRTTRQRKPIGSKNKDAQGYVRVKVVKGTGRWGREHVLVMEKAIKRKLRKGELVHHINLTRDENGLSNLFLCKSEQEHRAIHRSVAAVMKLLIEAGVVVFNRRKRIYEAVL